MTIFFCAEINALLFSVFFLFISLLQNAFGVERHYSFYLILMLSANLCVTSFFFPGSYSLFSSFTLEGGPSTIMLKSLFAILMFVFFVFLLVANYNWDEFESERGFLYLVIFTSGLFLTGTKDPLTVFIFIEIVSLASFGLIAINKTRYAYEAATKYLIFSSIASCFFIMSFITAGHGVYKIDSGLLNHYAIFFPNNIGALGWTSLSETLLAAAFFIKFGLGPFSGWLVDAYEAAKYRDFVFLSTVGKLPLVVAFAQIFTGVTNDFLRYFFVTFLFCFAIGASVLMVKQKKARRFFAYSGLFNYALGFILFFSANSAHFLVVKYFIYYTVIGLLTYIAFDLYRNYSADKQEPSFISELPRFGQVGPAVCFGTALILSSGLPPLGIFLMKAFAFGFFMVGSSYADLTGLLLTTFFFLILSIVNMFAYFKVFANTLSFTNSPTSRIYTVRHSANLAQTYLFSVLFLFFIPLNYYWMYFVR